MNVPKGAGALMGAEAKLAARPRAARQTRSGGGRGQRQAGGTDPPTGEVTARAGGFARHRGQVARGGEGSRGSRHASCLVLCVRSGGTASRGFVPGGPMERAGRQRRRKRKISLWGAAQCAASNRPLPGAETALILYHRYFRGFDRPASDHKPALFPQPERATEGDDRHDRVPEFLHGTAPADPWALGTRGLAPRPRRFRSVANGRHREGMSIGRLQLAPARFRRQV